MLLQHVESYLGENGRLFDRVPGFEFRPQQMEMAEAVARSFHEGSHLIVEAGTGTGKSLGYLLPAVLWAIENRKKVVISTYTRTLQQQILQHDIPLLREKLGLNFRYSLCLGHENYLSLRRMKRAGQAGLFTDAEQDGQLQAIFDWAGDTDTGIKGDLPFEPLPSVWEDVARQTDLCMGKNCETYDSCFYFREKKKWFGAHLLIVNHHLFFANVASNGAVLPRFDAVVFDEAQNIEEAATSFLGLEVANSYLFYFLDRLYNPRTRRGTLARIEHETMPQIRQQVGRVRRAVDLFFAGLLEKFGETDRVLRFYNPPAIDNSVYIPLQELHESLKSLEGGLNSEEDRLDIFSAANRCFEVNNSLSALLNQNLDGYVYWLEVIQKKRFPRVVLRGVPFHTAEELQEQVFSKIDRVVMTSATLTTHQGFEFIKERIGFEPEEEKILDAPFDYPSQAMLYVTDDLPEPSEEIELYLEALSRRVRELIEISEGRTFILFTSYSVLNKTYDRLEFLGSRYQLLRQGDIPTSHMIRRFKEIPSVIFGTSSFWQGVDIPGDALKSVIITKLPFDVPNEPLTEARIEDLRRKSIDPFSHYQIPRAIIQLKQGFGRLIRKKTDTGVVSILDSRVVRRGYGRHFLEALPACPVVGEIEKVREFFQGKDRGTQGED